MISLVTAPEMIIFYVGGGIAIIVGVLYGLFSK
jgi:hypothetical protein